MTWGCYDRGASWSVKTGRNGTHGPTSPRYCLAITLTTWAMCPRSCATQAAEQLAQGDDAQGRVGSGEAQVGRCQRPRANDLQVSGAQRPELLQERLQRPAGVALAVAKSIVRLEPRIGDARENDACTRNPVGLLAVDQVTDDIERTEGPGSLVGAHPGLGKAAEKRAQHGGSPRQDHMAGSISKFMLGPASVTARPRTP